MEKVYDIALNNDEQGVFAYSLVEEPANETEFIFLSKEQESFCLSSDEKRNITGLFLVPEQKIPRTNDRGEKYFIKFSAKNIEEISRRALKTGALNSVNIRHSGKLLEGITPSETWIVGKNDKIHAHMSADKAIEGSWAFTAHVADVDMWNDIKESGLKGFSIEILSGVKEVLSVQKTHEQMDSEIDAILKSADTDEVKLKKIEEIVG